MKTLFYTFVITICFLSCTNSETASSETIENLKAELASANEKIEDLQIRNSTESVFQHTVFFTLKPDLTDEERKSFVEQLKGLEAIEVVKKITVEERKNIGDEDRALKQFDVIMIVTFADEAALKVYDAHEIHQNLKKAMKGYLAGIPSSFDFVED
jgi:predicted transcriptional regulator